MDTVPRPASAVDYGAWLATRAPWQLFATLTIKDLKFEGHPDLSSFTHVGVAGSERFLRSWFRDSVRSRGFAAGTSAYAAFALEHHRDRVTPHFHGVIGGLPRWLVRDTELARRRRARTDSYLWHEWYRDHGHARIEAIRGVLSGDPSIDAIGVATYASKYMLKDQGKFYALGRWPAVSEYDEPPLTGDEVEDRWADAPGSANAERMWREWCEE